MKVINVKDKDFRQAFGQVRRWFLGNPNRRRVYLHFGEGKYARRTYVAREDYLTEESSK